MSFLPSLLNVVLAGAFAAQTDGAPAAPPYPQVAQPGASAVSPAAYLPQSGQQPGPYPSTPVAAPGQGQSVLPAPTPVGGGAEESTQTGPFCGMSPPADLPAPFGPGRIWPEVWGLVGIEGYYAGSRMAPNGVPYDPLFDMNLNLNIGLLPNKKLYIYALTDFWGEKAAPHVTNASQGSFDFSKREWDFDLGIAWNYWGPLELRFSGYAYNNLNRGFSLANPTGYNDGLAIENRYYFANANPYDIGKLSFLSIGYIPHGQLVDANGVQFNAGLTARAYLTYDIAVIRSYVYFDGQVKGEGPKPRLLDYDTGLAVRPWLNFQNLEFRFGLSGVYDVELDHDRALGYLAVRLQF